MNLEDVQKEVECWSEDDQDRLASYLVALRLKRMKASADKLLRRDLDDRNLENWLSFEEIKQRLAKESASK